MDNFKDAHYFPLPSQGNVYTFSHFEAPNGVNKILVAILKREVYYFEYQETASGALKPTLKEIPFTYIPAGAEIIALDVFNRSKKSVNKLTLNGDKEAAKKEKEKHDFVITIAIVKNNIEANTMESFLNIYSECEDVHGFNLENMAQNCFNIELNFVPYHLSHVFLPIFNNETQELISQETLIALSGGDSQIHFFRENKITHSYKEATVDLLKEHFPELINPPSIIMWLDIIYTNNNTRRITAFGCECGYLRIAKIDVIKREILFNISTKFVNTITCVKLYKERELIQPPLLSLPHFPLEKNQENQKQQTEIINLICVNSILPSVLFRDITEYGLQKYDSLKRLDTTSVNSCCEAADINFDGIKEVLIGSSCEEIAMYTYNDKRGFNFEEERKVVSPVLGVKYLDITGDGLRELIVFTLKGVYIFQYDHKYVEDILKERISSITIPEIQ